MNKWGHEFFLRNGTSFIVNDLIDVTVNRDEQGTIIQINVSGSESGDKIIFLNRAEVICIIRRKKRWKLWN